jgi:colicin import membrane protein
MTRIPPRQHLSAGGLSLLVHGFFLGFLLLGITWRNPPLIPVEAELWNALPEIPASPPPMAVPAPEPAPSPPPAEAAPPSKPDIALEQAEKKRLAAEAKRQAAEAKHQEDLRLQEQARQQEMQRQAEEAARLERERQDKLARERAERERKELARKEMELELARQASEELDSEAAQLEAAFQQRLAKAGRVARLIGENQERIRARIHSFLRLPPKLAGNPEVVFRVLLLPNGEVLRADLLRGSGQEAYDREVERAILKASPLPLPKDREAAAAFRDGLILKFRPQEKVG